jgi:hypothetical protein
MPHPLRAASRLATGLLLVASQLLVFLLLPLLFVATFSAYVYHHFSGVEFRSWSSSSTSTTSPASSSSS